MTMAPGWPQPPLLLGSPAACSPETPGFSFLYLRLALPLL